MASIARSTLLRQSALAARSASTRSAFAQPAFQSNVMKVAAFHSSSKRSAILPEGPQVVKGGVNDPAPIPEPNSSHGSYHWAFDRLLAAGLIPLTLAPFAAGSINPTMDAILCSAILVHSHLGFQSVITDYVPNRTYRKLRKFTWWALNAATLTVGIGLYEFETNDIGVTEAIKRVWKA